MVMLILLLTAGGTAARAAEASCLACHEYQKQQFEGSAHQQAGLSCRDCHGGNPGLADETAHTMSDFNALADKRKIAESCARCHSDVRRMNPYGIPTDQLERYKTSKHGERLFGNNDKNVATCTDCHGSHDILKVKSPQSRTFPTHIPQTCGRCHSDAKLMSQYNIPADVVEKYKSSYHAQLLFEKADLSAPTCITCHGNHGATPPGIAQVGQVCGKCHVRQRELFEQSPHALPATQAKFSECISCHGNHAIKKASIELFGQSCVQCHAQQPKALAVRDAVAARIYNTRKAYENAATTVQKATVRGLATEDEQLRLEEAKTQIMQLEALQHTLSPALLQPVADRTLEIVEETLKGTNQLERLERWKVRALIPISIFLAAMAVLFWAKRRQLKQKSGQ
jgi:hypothetical protein